MKVHSDASTLACLRRYFDEIKYAMIDFRLSFEAPISPTGFPRFEHLQKVVARLDGANRTVFRLFRLGEAVDNVTVEQTLPEDVRAAFQRTGLLQQHEAVWRTPSLLLVPVEGILLFVSVPPSYPTATAPCSVWFDLSSYLFAKALPIDLGSERVLDICSGSGVQSLLCAKRGAASVVGLELDPDAIELSRFNAVFNDVSARTEFRQSDKLKALRSDERFDFVLCNTPYAPVSAGPELPPSLDAIGNRILFDLVARLPSHLAARAHGVVALWRSIGTRDNNGQRAWIAARLAEAGLTTLAFVDRAQDGAEGMLRTLRADVGLRHGAESGVANEAAVRALLAAAGHSVDGCYNQLLFFKTGAANDSSGAILGLSDHAAAEAS